MTCKVEEKLEQFSELLHTALIEGNTSTDDRHVKALAKKLYATNVTEPALALFQTIEWFVEEKKKHG